MSPLFDSIVRTRALVYCAISAVFAVLLLYVTIRMAAQGADASALILVGGLTVGLWFQTWRWYRRFHTQPGQGDI